MQISKKGIGRTYHTEPSLHKPETLRDERDSTLQTLKQTRKYICSHFLETKALLNVFNASSLCTSIKKGYSLLELSREKKEQADE